MRCSHAPNGGRNTVQITLWFAAAPRSCIQGPRARQKDLGSGRALSRKVWRKSTNVRNIVVAWVVPLCSCWLFSWTKRTGFTKGDTLHLGSREHKMASFFFQGESDRKIPLGKLSFGTVKYPPKKTTTKKPTTNKHTKKQTNNNNNNNNNKRKKNKKNRFLSGCKRPKKGH